MKLRTATPDSAATSNDACADMIQAEYEELRGLAINRMRNEKDCHTLTGTALAHEVAAKMLNNRQTPVGNRGQFLAFANKAMRHYLIDYARTRGRHKRGGDREKVMLQEDQIEGLNQNEEQFEVAEALQHLEDYDTRKAHVVRLRCIDGLSNEQTAAALNISLATVKRDWHLAKAWLVNALGQRDPQDR